MRKPRCRIVMEGEEARRAMSGAGMMEERMIDEAIDWHLRQRDMAEADWEAFVAWLEADPANAAAYDRVAADDRLLADVPALSAPVSAPVVPPRPLPAPARRTMGGALSRRPWIAGAAAIAATLVLVASPISNLLRGPSGMATVRTRAGEHRDLTLADGTRVAMDGATTLRVDRGDPRVAYLDAGAAEFRVTHDAAHPFAVHSGSVTLEDVGTTFAVTRTGPRLEVAVAEGSVRFQPDTDALTLTAGRRLALDEARGRVTLGTVAPSDVAGWRGDRLSFSGEPLSAVAAALERRYGTPVTFAGGLSDQPFTGMIALSGSAERDIPHLAALIGANWRHERGAWILGPQTR